MIAPGPSSTQATATTASADERIDRRLRRIRRLGWLAATLAALLLAATTVLDFAVYGSSLYGANSLSLATINRIVQVAAIVAPVLSVIGAIGILAGGWGTLRRLRRQIADFPTGADAGPRKRLRAGIRIAQTVSALVVVASTAFGVATASGTTYHTSPASTGSPKIQSTQYHLVSHTERQCQWGTGQPIVCQFVITVDPQSNMTFNWVAVSNPLGVQYEPSSGSIAPGATSPTITATDTVACPVAFGFVDQGHGVAIESDFPSGGDSC